MTAPLLHLATPAQWRAALAAQQIAPSVADFVHLSTPEQVALPATRIYAGRADMMLLALDQDRIGVEVRWEPGVPTDPASMRFPHAYGAVPVSAVLAVLPYRPGPDGAFAAPALPPLDAAGRQAILEQSLLRRVATAEVPVTGGVAVLNSAVPGSHQHNQLLIDGPADACAVLADADRVLGGAGLTHRMARVCDAATAAGLSALGWEVEALVGMAAPAVGASTGRAEQLDLETLRPMWDAAWRRDIPGVDDGTVADLTDRYRLEQRVVDLRCLAVRDAGTVVASALLRIDGATALLDAVDTDPAHRGRGHGDSLVAEALAVAAGARCDLVVFDASSDDWPRHWYARRGFVEVTRSWSARLPD